MINKINPAFMLLKINFPAVAFSANEIAPLMKPIRNDTDLTHTYSKPFKNGYFKGLTIIDCEGLLFTVVRANKISYRGLFGYFLSDIKVELVFMENLSSLNLESFKAKFNKSIKNDYGFWSSSDNVEELLSFVKSATSHREIIEYYIGYCYKDS